MKTTLIDEIRLFLAAVRTTEGSLFMAVFIFMIAHCFFPLDPSLSKAMDAFTGALLFSLRATRQLNTQPTTQQNTP